jgi:hypothetical protein
MVTDSSGATGSQTLFIIITAANTGSPIITTTMLGNGKINVAYSEHVSATGGSGIFTAWAITSGALPAGVALNSATGAISGTPTASGIFFFTIQVTDSSGASGYQTLSIVVAAATNIPPAIITNSLPNGKINVAYSEILSATGGSGTYTAWAITSGTLPGGLSLNSTTGVISGIANTPGTFSFTVQVTDSNGAIAIQNLSIIIAAATNTPPVVDTTWLPGGKLNTAYSETVSASGGTGTYTAWAVTSGGLPSGLSLNATTGVISGTPTAVGTFTCTIQVTDSAGATGIMVISIIIAAS